MPKYLTAGIVVLAGWVMLASGALYAGLPAAAALVLTAIAYAYWEKRGRPWHEWTVILLLLPAIGCAVWIAVGGLVLDEERSNDARLLFEVGPGVGLTGLLCTLISYHGRHFPAGQPGGDADRC